MTMFFHRITKMTSDVQGYAVGLGLCVWRWLMRPIWAWKNLPHIKHMWLVASVKVIATLALQTLQLLLDSSIHSVSASFVPLYVASRYSARSCARLSHMSVLIKISSTVLWGCLCCSYTDLQWIFCFMPAPHSPTTPYSSCLGSLVSVMQRLWPAQRIWNCCKIVWIDVGIAHVGTSVCETFPHSVWCYKHCNTVTQHFNKLSLISTALSGRLTCVSSVIVVKLVEGMYCRCQI